MASKERTQEIFKALYDAVVAYDEKASSELSQTALEEGIEAYDAVMSGLSAGMEKVGQLYASHEYFVPQLLLCADALYAGLEILKPHIKTNKQEAKLKIVLGTVEGDIHDIGKNLVKIMFDAAGWTVYDLGRDVKIERFAEEQERTASDVVALSALMTTSMLAMPTIVKMVKAVNPSVAIMVGGAPLTPEIAKHYGADGYASNAGEAVRETVSVIASMKGTQAK
jgi:methanogenic corrinoid protein MtbC1